MTVESQTPLRVRQRVQFASLSVTVATPSPDSFSKFWYTNSEIESFRMESESLCEKIRKNRVKLCNMDNNNDDDFCCLRGFELLLSRERRRNQTLAIRTILASQQNSQGSPEQLAAAARRCTAWAREMARNTAVVDYYRVYMPEAGAFMQPALPLVLSPLAFLKQRIQEKEMQGTIRLAFQTSTS